MAVKFRVDITNAAGTLQGAGPITSISAWTVTKRMDRAGDWSFVMAGNDPQRSVVQVRSIAAIYALLGDTWTYIGGGYIDRVGRSVNADGTVSLTVDGSDMLRALTNTLASGEYDDTFGDIVNSILPTGWTATVATPPVNDLYTTLQYDTVLSAIVRLAERAQTHFYLDGDDTIVFNHAWSDSGVRAIRANGDLAAELAAITALGIEEQSYDVVSRVYPLGSGNSGAALGMLATTQTAPAGYTLDTANNYIESDAAATAYGDLHRRVDFKDIRPLSGTDADVQAAADMLYESALYWLQLHEAPTTAYRLVVAGCSSLLRPLQTIRLAYRDPDAGIALDDDLYILESTWSGDANGIATAELVVADSTQWPESDTSAIVDSITGGQVYQVHPQLNANSYVIPFVKPIDDDEVASFRFRFDDDVVQLNRVNFDFQLLPLESTVKSVGSATVTSASGGGATSSSNGSHSHDVTLLNHTHTVTVASHTHGVTLSDHTHTVTVAGHTHDVTRPDHSHGVSTIDHSHNVTTTDHTHSVTLSNHTHTTPNHTHSWPITLGGSVSYSLGFGAAGTAGGLVTTLSGSDFDYPTNSGEGGSTSGSGGGTTVSSAAGGGQTVTSVAGGAFSYTSTGGGGFSTTSSSGGGSTPTTSAGGGTTVSSAAGGGSTPTTSAGGGTTETSTSGGTHDHAVAAHTHDVTPSITTTYGIFRDSAANVYDLTGIEYSVDNATWYGFSVGVNGYTTLGDGWSRIDLTDLLVDSTLLRPTAANWQLQIRKKAAGGTGAAMIEAQLNIRSIIQAVALD